MFHSEWTWSCNHCKTVWRAGFFGNKQCPKCTGPFRRFFRLLGRIIGVIVLFFIILAICAIFIKKLSFYRTAILGPIVAIDSRDFFAYGYGPYLAGIANGKTNADFEGYYTLQKESPFYGLPAKPKSVARKTPKAMLSAKQVVSVDSVFRDSDDSWASVKYYEGAKEQKGFLLLPKNVKNVLTVYDREQKRKQARAAYLAYVKKNFKLIDFDNRNDLDKILLDSLGVFLLEDLEKGENRYAAYWADRPSIDAVHDWYLDPENIAMETLQHDKGFKRPAFVLEREKDRGYFALKKTVPYSAEMSDEARENPTATLPANQVVRMRAVLDSSAFAWGAVDYYEGDELVSGYVALPKDWDAAVSAYAPSRELGAARGRYAEYVKKHFRIIEFKGRKDVPKEEIDALGAYLLDDIPDPKNSYAALKTDKAAISKVRSWYMDPTKLDIDALQHAKGYKRPAQDYSEGKE